MPTNCHVPERLRMTPGPTEIPPAVRERLAEPIPNPDLEPEFFECYRALADKLTRIHTADADGSAATDGRDTAILAGEGILGLEAAIDSLVSPGDRVLCLSNGRYGDGFADFVTQYDGDPVTCSVPWDETLDPDTVETAIEDADEPFDVATMVHCETPTGTLNDLGPVLDVLNEHEIISVVDAVSSLGATPVPTDRIDVCLGASQKCFSAPPGLSTATISERAWDRIETVENRAHYTDLTPWRTAADEDEEWFPYTHMAANIRALDAAADQILEEGPAQVFERHREVAAHCRDRAADLGLEPYPTATEDCSPTVTALEYDGSATDLQETLREEHDIVLATGLGELEDDIIRVGHMGHNARRELVDETMDALATVLE
ncbi:class V aminotransferase [Natrialba chahannaoensis JCM 10990]|uniref:Class V aminotransferase n=1 Tax=Natrialba chahannaoensis JCM 10990 TaxID=1227492 RepID=M0ADI9_9EURY|nr:alanine--glyoxylate aminotransferase family protein [Natrialba chahannaoensis]ELY96589.1 class V aminotransferase [Natrialba chahannaoensis JCM 10990]